MTSSAVKSGVARLTPPVASRVPWRAAAIPRARSTWDGTSVRAVLVAHAVDADGVVTFASGSWAQADASRAVRRRTLPGLAPVTTPSASTGSPLTTTCAMPTA